MHGDLDDFTSCVENGRCPPLDTSEHNTARCCRSAQNIILNVADLQVDAVFHGMYGAWFIPTLSFRQPKGKKSGDVKSPQFLFHTPV
jgi:hypothetical protein